jgi:hypothetical protein
VGGRSASGGISTAAAVDQSRGMSATPAPAWMVPIVSLTIWNDAARRADEGRV